MNSPHDQFSAGQYYMDSITVASVDGTASRMITITIVGTNDVPIITGTYTGSITETDVTQSITGTLYISNDPDSETTYFIPQTDVSGNNRYGKFSIDTSGNWSYTMNSPHNEFEAGQTYTDSIMVHSNDGSASQAITVTMSGINDAPIITSGMFDRISSSIGTATAYTVTAVDPDMNAVLTYSISGGVDASLFNIDASSGAVSFKTTPTPRVYSFTVAVSDGSLSATQNVVLMVTSSSVANYPLITGNQTSITTSSVIYGDITVSNLNIASGVEIYLASGSTMTALSGTFQGSLSGAGNLLKSGTGELTLSSSNTDFTGVLKVTEGTVKIESADALGSGSVQLGASDSSGNATLKFDFTGPTSITNDIVASSTGENLVQNTGLYTLTLSGNVTKDGTTLTLSGDIEVSVTIEGSSANSDVIVSGDTVYTSSSTTDYNGPTTIQDGGTLTLENGVSIPNSDVTVESGGLFIIESTSMPTSVTANSVTLETNSMMNLNSGYLKTDSLTISNTSSGSYASINLVPGNSAIIETGDLTISTMLYINISDALTSGSYDLIEWTGTSVVTGSVIVYYSGVSTVSISGAFNYTSKKYTITVTPATSSSTYTVGGTITGNTSEVVLKLNGTTDTLTIASGQTDAAFTFSTGLTSGTSYTVTVYSYSSSTQSYVLNYSTGTISSSNISNVSLVFSDVTNPDGNICFPANTPVLTNLGYIPIAKIDPAIHNIRNKKIIAVTKTVTNDKHLVRIAKDALGKNYPSKTVYSSRNHKVFYKGQMVKAKHLVELVENVSLVPYNGEPLYNILLEQHEKMQVNNLIVETLHPEHKVAKLYIILGMLTPSEQADLITIYNKYDREYRPLANK
jgi:VCBS repeat-containing protein/autotransporter-associated beta strand protein